MSIFKKETKKQKPVKFFSKIYPSGQYDYSPFYGDITKLNKNGIILRSVGKKILHQICLDLMELMDTSIAIYELNGDYAFGMFVSGWCQIMDAASRKLCGEVDNKAALASGKWLCHENCWNQSALTAMNSKKPTDIKCIGGIHLYAEPIFADGNLIGAINLGYGAPPRDKNTLNKLARNFQLDPQELLNTAQLYEPRPEFIIQNARKRLHSIAMTIGNIVEKVNVAQALKKNQQSYQLLSDVTFEGIILHNNGITIDVNQAFCRITGYSYEECMNSDIFQFINDDGSREIARENLNKEIAKPYIINALRKNGEIYLAELEARSIHHQDSDIRITAVRDVTEKFHTQQLLKESNDRYEALINQLPEALFLHNDRGIILEVNQKTIDCYGYSRQELLQMKIGDFDVDFFTEDHQKSVWIKVKDNQAYCFQSKHRMKNGDIFPVEVTLGKVKFDRGTHYIALAQDITQRIEKEKQIRINQQKYKMLLDNIPDPVFIQNMDDGKIIAVNNAAVLKYGYSKDELINMKPADFDFKPDEALILHRLRTLQQKKQLTFQVTHHKKDGSAFPVELHALVVEFANQEIFINLCRDITQQVHDAQILKNSEEKFRLLAQNSVDCIWQMDKKLKFTYLSPSLFQMAGALPQEWIGTHLWNHMPRREFIKIGRLALTFMRDYISQKYLVFETVMFNKDAQLKPLEIVARPLIKQGKLIGLQGSTRMIIERKKQEEELKKYRDNLEEMVKERTLELEKMNEQLVHYNKLFIGREHRIKELRDQVARLKKELIKYTSRFSN